jgi:hypothetical protein
LPHDKNNCVSCCIICNKFKLDRSLLDFYNNINTLNVSPLFKTASQLNNTINLAQNKIDKEKYYEIIQTQVNNAIKWCKKYTIEINKNSIYYKKNIV